MRPRRLRRLPLPWLRPAEVPPREDRPLSAIVPIDRWDSIPKHERIRWLASGPYRDSGETLAEHLARLIRVDPDLPDDVAAHLALFLEGLYERVLAGDLPDDVEAA